MNNRGYLELQHFYNYARNTMRDQERKEGEIKRSDWVTNFIFFRLKHVQYNNTNNTNDKIKGIQDDEAIKNAKRLEADADIVTTS